MNQLPKSLVPFLIIIITYFFTVSFIVVGPTGNKTKHTNPKNHKHYVYDEDNQSSQFLAEFWMTYDNSSKDVNKIKYKFHHKKGMSFEVVSIYLLDKEDQNEVKWTRSCGNQLVKKGKKPGNEFEITGISINWDDVIWEVKISAGGRINWLTWDADVSGGASTATSFTRTGQD